MRTLRVYGRLAKFLGRRTFEIEVASAAEAVRFLLANFPQVERHMADQHYRVRVGDRTLEAEQLHEPAGGSGITIVPIIGGAGAAGRVIAGVALVGLSLLTAGATIGLLGLAAPFAISPVIAGIGASLALGGVAQLLTPVPRMAGPGVAIGGGGAMSGSANSAKAEDNDPRKNYSFSGIQNNSRAGLPIPIGFGEVIVGSIKISESIDVDQVAA
jgi:predicted phage tail protein